jgi:hypothetical protein
LVTCGAFLFLAMILIPTRRKAGSLGSESSKDAAGFNARSVFLFWRTF